MEANPFTLSFGMEPPQYISRHAVADEIVRTITSENPASRVFMISGVRGSGKTVMLSNLTDTFSRMKDWIVVNVIPDLDILQTIAAKLYSQNELQRLLLGARIDLSAFGLGVTIEDSHQIFDIETALEKILQEAAKHGKHVLITIDEMVSNEHVKIFASAFQLLMRQKLPVFLLMTGLYENIYNLQNEKTLTFLYRAPKIMMEPLSLNAVARSYQTVLRVDAETAAALARLTKGYPFAYQVLGYLYWKSYTGAHRSGNIEELLPEYDGLLEDYVYEKIWFELPGKEKDILLLLSENEITKIETIRGALNLTSGSMSVYRDRLQKKGLVDTSRYGHLSLKLPRFGEIIQIWRD